MQIIRTLLVFCLVIGVTTILSSCAPKAKEEVPPTTVEEETSAPEEETAPVEESEEGAEVESEMGTETK